VEVLAPDALRNEVIQALNKALDMQRRVKEKIVEKAAKKRKTDGGKK
jgi:hypothetical protein